MGVEVVLKVRVQLHVLLGGGWVGVGEKKTKVEVCVELGKKILPIGKHYSLGYVLSG